MSREEAMVEAGKGRERWGEQPHYQQALGSEAVLVAVALQAVQDILPGRKRHDAARQVSLLRIGRNAARFAGGGWEGLPPRGADVKCVALPDTAEDYRLLNAMETAVGQQTKPLDAGKGFSC